VIYEVQILDNSKIDEFEGMITVKLGDQILLVAYQTPLEFAKEYIQINKILSADLWLFYGKAKKIEIPSKEIPNNPKIAGGKIKGQVKAVFSSREFRVDCGLFEIDIMNEEDFNIYENDYIETKGTYQIFFPGTDWSKDNCW